MKAVIQAAVEQAIVALVNDQTFPDTAKDVSVTIDRTKDASHGDFACNVAMQLAKPLQKKPVDIASALVAVLENQPLFSAVEIAGPGFINFRLSTARYNDLVAKILSEQSAFGKTPTQPNAPKTLIEFVSANPTGPLHVGHGRGAAYGATLANLLRAAGGQVDCEYYVNDAGRQMDILALSVYLRYLEKLDVPFFDYPQALYQADYCREIAKDLIDKEGAQFKRENFFPAEKETTTDNEAYIDQLIAKAKLELKADYAVFFDAALNRILDDIKSDLSEFGVEYQHWYSEKSLFARGKIEQALAVLQEKGHLYPKAGALWFKATDFGDEKDRVVQRDNGAYTYFASDIAYHHDKFLRGYTQLIDIMGADHHGYMARVKAAMQALGHRVEKLHFELVQFAVLYQDGEKMPMSTRSGKYVTLRDLRTMIGNSAARFFYVMRKPQQHMDFDLSLATRNNKDNPLYYIQYAHARICQLLNKIPETTEQPFDGLTSSKQIEQLRGQHELALLKILEKYPEVIQSAASDYAPHLLIHYLKDLAMTLHGYYDAGNIKFLKADSLQMARFALLTATRQVLKNGLNLSGVEAPERM